MTFSRSSSEVLIGIRSTQSGKKTKWVVCVWVPRELKLGLCEAGIPLLRNWKGFIQEVNPEDTDKVCNFSTNVKDYSNKQDIQMKAVSAFSRLILSPPAQVECRNGIQVHRSGGRPLVCL
jgi:hypothetical protein